MVSGAPFARLRPMARTPTLAASAGWSPRRIRLGGWTRAALVTLEAFVGIGAVYGGIRLLADADGFGIEASWLDGTPFPDYTIPGLVLLVVIGGSMLAAAALALRGSDWAAFAAFCAGVVLLVFLAVETAAIGYQGSAQAPLLVVCGASGFALAALGSRSLRG
jgi:hypothetical protein